ncbi:hypothetical protein [Acinetobacter johnsonii]|uniref:hypothetical protein n=1 Tax=Acinetobacter johnsonii TaxID=40214 RepID=UPI0032B4B221
MPPIETPATAAPNAVAAILATLKLFAIFLLELLAWRSACVIGPVKLPIFVTKSRVSLPNDAAAITFPQVIKNPAFAGFYDF